MPVLPISFYSNYYTFEWIFNGQTTGFLANKFEVTTSNNASPQLMVQGKPGFVAQNVPTAWFKYTIEAPMLIINQSTGDYLSNYNSLTPLANYLINLQWNAMLNSSATPLGSIDVVLESFSLSYGESGVSQSLQIVSNVDLVANGYFNYWLANENPNFVAITSLISRTMRNYDLFTDMQYDDDLGNLYTLVTSNDIFLESGKFDIKFDVEKKYFGNQIYNGPTICLVLKNYSFSQSYGIVGLTSASLATDYYFSGLAFQRDTTNILQVGDGTILLNFQAPMIVKDTTYTFAEDQLTHTNYMFEIYGVTFSPDTSPYNGNLLYLYN